MNASCERIEADLPLYAEGELGDPARSASIARHLEVCADCREWLSSYRSFTEDVLETVRGESGICEEPRADRGSGFTSRVMAEVHRVERARRAARRWSVLSAAALLAILPAAGLYLWLGPDGWSGGDGASPEAAFAVRPTSAARLPRAAQRPLPDLKAASWILGPGGEAVEVSERSMETLLYGLAERDAAEARVYLMLRALLGADPAPEESSGGYRLVMIPEDGEGSARRAIPLRPVAWPVSIEEGDLARGARVRLAEPRRRYRIVRQVVPGFPLDLRPVSFPPAQGELREMPELRTGTGLLRTLPELILPRD